MDSSEGGEQGQGQGQEQELPKQLQGPQRPQEARKNADGWPVDVDGRPLEPDPMTCCGNDCHNCVWIQFDEQMGKFERGRAAVP